MNELEQDRVKNQNQLADLSLTDKFRSLGFEHLTDIQKKAVPVVYQKIDSLIVAPTGSGKTESSVIHMI